MIVHDVQQGSGEWLALRAGKLTASAFDQIVTPKWKVRTGEMPRTYAALVAGERLLGLPFDDFASAFTDRGTMLEDDALPWYELTTDAEVQRVGFVTLGTDTTAFNDIGCSPDGLVDVRGAVEVKCPAVLTKSAQYIKCMLGTDAEAAEPYIVQAMGQIWICEREWCDLVFYHPELPKRVVRVHRDEKAIEILANAVGEVARQVTANVEKLKSMM